MLTSSLASLPSLSRADIRPLRGVEGVRAPQPERRERVEGGAGDSARSEGPAPAEAAGYGRPAARLAASSHVGPSAFLAQLIGQRGEEPAGAARARLKDGLAAYRRTAGEDLVVLGPAGPAGSVGLVL